MARPACWRAARTGSDTRDGARTSVIVSAGLWGLAVKNAALIGPRRPVDMSGKPTRMNRNIPDNLTREQKAELAAYDKGWVSGHAKIPFWKRKWRA